MAAEQLDNLQEKMNWHWRNSMRTVRFLAFDARAAMPLPLLLVHARLSTLLVVIASLMFFRALERKGLTFSAALRNFRSWLVGKDRPGFIGVFKKKFTDYG